MLLNLRQIGTRQRSYAQISEPVKGHASTRLRDTGVLYSGGRRDRPLGPQWCWGVMEPQWCWDVSRAHWRRKSLSSCWQWSRACAARLGLNIAACPWERDLDDDLTCVIYSVELKTLFS